MPVAIALGGDPAMIYAASAPLPPGVDEVVFAGWLRGRGVELVRVPHRRSRGPGRGRDRPGGLRRPAASAGSKGPFGDHTGYYSLARDYPVFHLTAVTRRAAPDLPGHPGRAAAAGGLLARQGHRAAVPADHRLMLPEVVDMNMPAEGVFHNLVIVSIRKRYPGHARKVM